MSIRKPVKELIPGDVLKIAPKVEVLGWYRYWTTEGEKAMVMVGQPFTVPSGLLFEKDAMVKVLRNVEGKRKVKKPATSKLKKGRKKK